MASKLRGRSSAEHLALAPELLIPVQLAGWGHSVQEAERTVTFYSVGGELCLGSLRHLYSSSTWIPKLWGQGLVQTGFQEAGGVLLGPHIGERNLEFFVHFFCFCFF